MNFLLLCSLFIAPITFAEIKINPNAKGNFVFERDLKALASTLQVVVRTGSLSDPKGKEGLAKIAFESILRGTQKKSRVEFYSAMERLGAQMGTDTASNRTIISLDTINENMEATIALMAEAILQPGLREEDVKALVQEELAGLNQEKGSNRAMLKRTVRQALYQGSPLAFPSDGTIEGLQSITVNDIKTFLATAIVSENIIFAATSNRSENEIKSLLQKYFSAIPTGKRPAVADLAPRKLAGKVLYLVSRKGSSTTEMAFAHFGFSAPYKDKEVLELGQFVFGADFTSRLPTVLRKENGWTYGAFSGFQMLEKPRSYGGTFLLYAFPQAQFTEKTVLKALEMYESYVKDGITNDELKFAKQSLINSYPFEFASSKSRLVSRLYQRLDGGITLSVPKYKKKIAVLNTNDVKAAIQKIHDAKNLAIVLVGEPEIIKALGKSIPEITSVIEVDDPMKGI